ncbi:MAG: glycosyltransferase family 1 protein [Bacteroidota bacterium]
MQSTTMPRLLIDLYKTRNLNSGIGQFSINFAEAISKKTDPGYIIDFLCPRNFPKGNWEQINLQKVNFQKRYFPWFNNAYDIWHSLYQFPSHIPSRRSKWILTIHDLNFIIEKDKWKSDRYLKKLQYNVDRAAAISVISDFTRTRVLEHLDLKGKPLFRIYNGISVKAFPGAERPRFLSNDRFFFTIGIVTAKKNFHVLIPLLQKFPGYDLVIAGENDSAYAKGILDQINVLKLTGRVHLPGKISEQDRYWLYSHCRAFLFPSLAEGFGMPVVEAMLLGKPVFTSTFASLPEIGDKYAFYWQNFDPDHMAEVMNKGLETCDRQKEGFSEAMTGYAQKFNWRKCIDSYLSMYKEVFG